MHFTRQKATGAHFTPPDLAGLVGERLAPLLNRTTGRLRILDPACGDGELLRAMSQALPPEIRDRTTLVGVENDDAAFQRLQGRRETFGGCRMELIQGDFLDLCEAGGPRGEGGALAPVDAIIANPPYVRTQVLGAHRAQRLAARFQLTGRIDLYQAFLVAMSRWLRADGALGVILSNRFLTTRAGAATRQFLRTEFDVEEVVDLGDTKLFEASVLPALVFARKRPSAGGPPASKPRFIRIYESPDRRRTRDRGQVSALDCVRGAVSGELGTSGAAYRVAAGALVLPDDEMAPWTMLTEDERNWVRQIESHAACRIGDVARVRVGIKTTADEVFLRDDWDALPDEICPESRHLRPVVSRDEADQWRPLQRADRLKRVLYTHEVVAGRRRAIRFDIESPTWRYLLTHRERLSARRYLREAGREWYEIWVPQEPTAWELPKIVFPDISPGPRFFLDESGCLVDGNCYWITANEPQDVDLLLLMLGVANSALMARYHDLAFQNRLYSQRKRHLTQYVARYPLPDRDSPASRQLIDVVRRLAREQQTAGSRRTLSREANRLVERAFGRSRGRRKNKKTAAVSP